MSAELVAWLEEHIIRTYPTDSRDKTIRDFDVATGGYLLAKKIISFHNKDRMTSSPEKM